MSNLAELLERVKAATGPDRELDAAICAHFRVLSPAAEKERWVREWEGPVIAKDGRVWLAHDNGLTGLNCDARPVTASLDAALALVERVLPEMEFSISTAHHRKGWAVKTWLTDDKYSGRLFDAVTPALALLAALLSALIAKPASDDVGSFYPNSERDA